MELWVQVPPEEVSASEVPVKAVWTQETLRRCREADALVLEGESGREELVGSSAKKCWIDEGSIWRCEGETCAVGLRQEEAFAAIGSANWVCLKVASMIGLENVISKAAQSGTKVAACVGSAKEVYGAAFALDAGVDALVVPLEALEDVWRAAVDAKETRRLRLTSGGASGAAKKTREASLSKDGARVTRIESGILADRVAVDLVRTLEPGEGALVGSASSALVLAHGETLPSSLVNPRPFRVNAGPVHSYVLMADGTAKHLCELKPCDHVCVLDANTNNTRTIAVGRLKIETRPHLCIHFHHNLNDDDDDGDDDDGGGGGRRGNNSHTVFLQQAETVRVLVRHGTVWRPKSVTNLVVGDVIAASFADGFGAHCGVSIDVKVRET